MAVRRGGPKRVVGPVLKDSPAKVSAQKQRRRAWEREYKAAREVVKQRAAGRCEICKERPDTSTHHKRGRVGPGVNHPDMLMRLCLWCDHKVTTEPQWAYDNGYSIRRNTLDHNNSEGDT